MKKQQKTSFNYKMEPFLFLLLITIFIISYTQVPLYTGNQNTYFLHGLANGGLGFLSYDWMANTADPFPIFSILVNLTYSTTATFLFYIYYSAILGIFIFSIMGITSIIWGINQSNRKFIIFFTLVVTVCSAAFSYLSTRLLGINLGGIMEDGLTCQSILGGIFQPSVFGVLILLSIYMFLRKKVFIAILLLGLAVSFHASYLLSAAALTLSYMTLIVLEEKNYNKAFLIGFISLIIVVPTIVYIYLFFSPTSQEITSQAQSILVNFRIPHHAKISIWFNTVALIQIFIIILALIVHRKKKVFFIIFIPFAISLLLTLIQIITYGDLLGVSCPWRISTFLVPLSSFLLIGAMVSFVFQKYKKKINTNKKIIDMNITSVLIILLSSGLFISYYEFKLFKATDYLPLMKFVTNTKSKDDIYLIPTKLERFRLQTGAQIFVDHKTHPYKDSEVIEWYNRIQTANNFFDSSKMLHCNALRDISLKYQVTHVVVDNREHSLNCDFLLKTFNDEAYSIYRIKN